MKQDFNKPLRADYMKQKVINFFWSVPVKSGEKSYALADMPLVAIGRILIIFAVAIIGFLNPFAEAYPGNCIIAVVCLVFIIIAESFYLRKFVYRFGRFRIKWEDGELHPDEQASGRCDNDGKFLKNEENRKATGKSRRAFTVLFAGITAAVLLYCYLGVGLSYLRVYSWRMGEIEEVKQVAQKYDSVFVGGWVNGAMKDGKYDISEQDMQRLWEILDSMKWDYVYTIQIYNNTNTIYIGFHTVFGYSYLVWYENADSSQAEHFADTVIQIDEHWFYMKMEDGRQLY